MPVSDPTTAHSTTISFGTSNFEAHVLSIKPPGWTVADVPTTHAETEDAKTYMPGDLEDWDTLDLTIEFDPANPPRRGEPEEIVITFKSGVTWTFDGYINTYQPGDTSTEGDDRMEGSISVKVNGGITVTPAGS